MQLRMAMSVAMTAVLAAPLALVSSGAMGQQYPAKPIKITTVSQGGALDTVLRLITQGITPALGQSIVVENKPSSVYPEDGLAKAAPDGYSLGYFANTLWLAPFLRKSPPYDPLKDLAPISLTVKGPNVVAVTASLPVNSVPELVALARARPGKLNVSVTGVGTSPHMAAVLFESVTATKMTEIKYKGTAQAYGDVVSGLVEVTFPTLLTSVPYMKSGKVKTLAITTAQVSPLAPDLPTVASFGFPGYESVAIHALVAPARTPAAIIGRLNQEIVKFLSQAEVRTRISGMGFDTVASAPAQLGAAMKSEMDRMGPVLREAGILPGDAND